METKEYVITIGFEVEQDPRGLVRWVSRCQGFVAASNWLLPVRAGLAASSRALACSQRHFDKVIDSLKGVKGIDFNQGLDARLLTASHAGRLAELHLKAVRLAWDHTKDETSFRRAAQMLIQAGIPKSKIQVYVLIGYHDTPEDALYRLQSVWSLGFLPNPMRYQPLKSTIRNEYRGQHWTHRELSRYMRYWSNLRITSRVPFEEFGKIPPPQKPSNNRQMNYAFASLA